MPFITCNRILVVRTDRIGDVVLTTPVFKALRKAYPAAKISVLVSPVTVDLVQGNPYIDEVLVDDRQGKNKGPLGLLRLARQVRQGHFDCAFILHTKRRTNLACFLAGVPMRVGYKNNKHGFLLTHPVADVRHHGLKHETQLCLDVVRSVGVETGKDTDIFIPAHKDAEQWAINWMAENDVHPGHVIAIHPGASDLTRCWPVASFAHLVEALINRYSLKVVLIGGKDTMGFAQEIARLSNSSVLNLAGQTSIGQMSSVLRRCRLLISNNSGPMLMGSGLNIYVIALFLHLQAGVNPQRWGPLGSKGFFLTNKPGEEIILDKKGQIQKGKLDSISVQEVLDLVEQIFQQDNQSLFYW